MGERRAGHFARRAAPLGGWCATARFCGTVKAAVSGAPPGGRTSGLDRGGVGHRRTGLGAGHVGRRSTGPGPGTGVVPLLDQIVALAVDGGGLTA